MRIALVTLLIVAGLGGAAIAAPTSTPSTYPVSPDPKPQLLPASARASAWKPDFAAVRDYAKRRAGDVRISVIGIDGRRWGHHQGRSTPILSTIKVMFLTAYLRRIRDRDLTDEDRDLLAPMIKRSAGQESKRVARIVGADAVRGLAKRAGMDRFRYRDDGLFGLSPTTAEEQARFMHKLERYLPDRHQRIAFRLLKSIVPKQRWGIAMVAPRGWELYFKNGWGEVGGRVEMQMARLERGRCKLSLAVFIEDNPGSNYGRRTLKGAAERLTKGLGPGDCP